MDGYALGSTIGMTDSSGALVTTYSYDPYGGTMSGGAGSYNTSEFTGRENDGTGLYYYRARYYDPAIGRFINPDPIGFGGGINFYAYVGDNPISFVDPFGMDKGPGPNPNDPRPTPMTLQILVPQTTLIAFR
jgi:RHS repeat-associated protein